MVSKVQPADEEKNPFCHLELGFLSNLAYLYIAGDSCYNDCRGNGRCANALCECDDGFYGGLVLWCKPFFLIFY